MNPGVKVEFPRTPKPKIHNCVLPKPDALGRYRPIVGKFPDGKPARFQVGTTKTTTAAEAQRRLDAIRLLFLSSCEDAGTDYWGWAYKWAKLLCNGNIKIHGSEYSKRNPGQAAEELGIAHRLIAWGLPVTIVDYDLQASGTAFIKEMIEMEVKRAVAAVLENESQSWGADFVKAVQSSVVPENITNAETKTFFEALGTYENELKTNANGNIKANTHRKISQVKYLKEHHQDLPLWRLDLTECQKMVSYWASRPNTKKGRQCSADHSKGMIKFLFSFFKWLDSCPSFKWSKPKGFSSINRKVEKSPKDSNDKTAFATCNKITYTPQQLATLVQYTDAYGKAIIGMAVNCAFGASEIGQWAAGGYWFNKEHPYAKKIGFDSTAADSFVVGDRPKSNVYGEHFLWEEVAAAVKPFITDGRSVLTITRTGKPWFRPHSANPQAAFGNWWRLLLDRVVKEHPDFSRLPFGSLRELFPDVLRREYTMEIADIALMHGDPSEHDLLKCYTNTPYAKLFNATRVLKPMFQVFLDKIK